MRKILLGVAALAAVATPIIATAGSANAATTDAAGVVTVTKGDIQSRMGWNNSGWDTYLLNHTPQQVCDLITAAPGETPVAAGMWYLNGRTGTVVGEETYTGVFSFQNEGPDFANQTIDSGTSGVTSTPVLKSGALKECKVTASPTVSWTVHTPYNHTYVPGTGTTGEWKVYGPGEARKAGDYFVRHTTIQWANTAGVGGLTVNGKAVTVSPYVAPAV